MKYKLSGWLDNSEIEHSSIEELLDGDYGLWRTSGFSYDKFTCNNKEIKIPKDVYKREDIHNLIKAEIGFIDDFTGENYVGADAKNNNGNMFSKGCDCGCEAAGVYKVKDLFYDTREKIALCETCLEYYKKSGYEIEKVNVRIKNKKARRS